MSFMFSYSNFTSDISKWDIYNVKVMNEMFLKYPLKPNHIFNHYLNNKD